MYAEGRVRARVPGVLTVSRAAILFPGGAAYAYVDQGAGAYAQRRVKLGRQGDDVWEVLSGLEEGDRVVTSGNVLIDAQAQFNQGREPDAAGADAAELAATEAQPVETPMAMAKNPADTAVAADPMPAPGGRLNPAQEKALAEFLAVADGISRALAADNLDQLKGHTGKLPNATASVVQAFGPGHPWRALLQRLAATAHWPAPANLDAARQAFLPFSTNVVELVQLVRGQAEAFRSLKVYQCPMAPPPGLWFQAQGPLRNPYYGAKMLTCGNEIRPAAAPAPAAFGMKEPTPAMPPPVMPAPATSTLPAATRGPVASSNLVIARRDASNIRANVRESLQLQRWEAIAAASREKAAEAAPSNMLPASSVSMPMPKSEPVVYSGLAVTKEMDQLRQAFFAQKRSNAAAQAVPPSPASALPPAGAASGITLTAGQRQALTGFLAVAANLSQALAADDLAKVNPCATNLPGVLAPLSQEFGAGHPWRETLQRLAALKWQPAQDLAGARQQFLPFSTATVELAKALRKADPAFGGLKIYHCPMAPPPGLWLQAQGPLRNPFYGARMLTCGEEVGE